MKQNMRGIYSTMKKTMIWAICLLSITACAQRNGGDKRFGDKAPRFGGGNMMKNSKEDDSTFVALKNETLGKFRQFTFEDAATGKTMQYNLLIPDGYDGKTSYPLVLFMADASTVGKEVTAPLTQGYGALEFAQGSATPSFVCAGAAIHRLGRAGRLEHHRRGGDDHPPVAICMQGV